MLSKEQSNIQKHRSIIDNLITIKPEIKKTFDAKHHLNMVNLDITKMFDSV